MSDQTSGCKALYREVAVKKPITAVARDTSTELGGWETKGDEETVRTRILGLMLLPLAHLGLQDLWSSDLDAGSCLSAEQLQIKNERLASELVQLKEQRDRETLQLREEVQKWTFVAEYYQSLLRKCFLRIEETVSSLETAKRELRAPGDPPLDVSLKAYAEGSHG